MHTPAHTYILHHLDLNITSINMYVLFLIMEALNFMILVMYTH